MDRSTRPPPLKLVANYHNFSYPRVRSAECPCPSTTNTSTASSSCQCSPAGFASMDRSSVGSEASAPGLIDDGTDDSDLSPDEDCQSHVISPCLWDSSSVWESSKTDSAVDGDCHSAKTFPTLLPLPASSSFAARRRSKSLSGCPTVAAWPLPNTGPRDRKPAADYTMAKARPTYSAIPKPMLPHIVTELPQRMASLSPILVTEPDAGSPAPTPPPRSANRPVFPTIRHITPSDSQFPQAPKPSLKAVPKSRESLALSPALRKFPSTPGLDQVAARLDVGPPVPPIADNVAATYDRDMMCRASQVCRSIAHIGPPRPAPRPEPQFCSYFDYDTDSDCPSDDERERSFFRFNRRSDSQGRRRSAKALSPSVVDPSAHASKHQTPAHKRQTHVLGRMLGRRSR